MPDEVGSHLDVIMWLGVAFESAPQEVAVTLAEKEQASGSA